MIGNDIVDFRDAGWPPPLARERLWRFSQRVCAPAEQARLARCARPQRLLWLLFASKEAAYKAVSRVRGPLPFAHQSFVVAGDLASVSYDDLQLSLCLDVRARYVHALVWSGPQPPFVRVGLSHDRCASDAVRELAATMIAERLGCAPAGVQIVRPPLADSWDGAGPPQALIGGTRAPLSLSLSHHGRFVGACARLEQTHTTREAQETET